MAARSGNYQLLKQMVKVSDFLLRAPLALESSVCTLRSCSQRSIRTTARETRLFI